jgi:hypothetical protein
MGSLCDTDDDNVSSIDNTDITAIELSERSRKKGLIDELSSAADYTIGNSTMTSYYFVLYLFICLSIRH